MGDVGVNPHHGCIVGPAAYLHGDFFRHIEMVGERGEAVAESVDSNVSDVILLADSMDLAQEVGTAASHDWTRRFALLLKQFLEFRN